MDDQVLVEPDVGTRAYQSVQVAEEGVELLLGEDALNREKDAEEGRMETQKFVGDSSMTPSVSWCPCLAPRSKRRLSS